MIGLPGPKGSRNRNAHGGSYDQSKVAAKWQQDVVLQARSARIADGLSGPLAPPYRVTIDFVMPAPAKPTYAWPVKGDLDKLERATLDGLQKAGLIEDDKHVIESHTRKRWGDVGYAHIAIETIDPH